MGVLMTEYVVDLEDEALAAAAELYGTSSPADTLNMALREAVARLRRAQALAELVEIAKAGQFDDLPDE